MTDDGSSPPWLESIPVLHFKTGFTTNQHITHPFIEKLPLTDDALGVHKISSRTSHRTVKPPEPVVGLEKPCPLPPPDTAWEACYPTGSVNPTAPIPGGFSFYLSGPDSFSRCLERGAKDVLFSYRMMLEPGWEWAKGGKLPGVCMFLHRVVIRI